MEQATDYLDYFIQLTITYAPKLLLALLVLIIGWWLTNWITARAMKALNKSKVKNPEVESFLSSLLNLGLKILLLISIAGIVGVETASFVGIIAAMGFAVGLALQGNLSNFASGVMILMFKPYKIGDFVEIGGKTGKVDSIQMFTTILMTTTHRKIIIPNGVVTSGVIENISGQEISRVDVILPIPYDEDIDRVKAVAMEVAASCPKVLKEPATKIIVKELADSSINLSVRPWSNGEDFLAVRWYMQENLVKALRKNNISIPFPQLDIQLKNAFSGISIENNHQDNQKN